MRPVGLLENFTRIFYSITKQNVCNTLHLKGLLRLQQIREYEGIAIKFPFYTFYRMRIQPEAG